MIFTFIFILSFNIFAATELDEFIEDIIPKTSLSNQELKNLREELKVQKLMIEEVQALKMKGVKIANLNTDDSIRKIQEMLMRSFNAKETAVTDEISDAIKKGLNFENIKKSMGDFKNFLTKSFVSKKIQGASLIRQYGMEVGLIYMASLQIDVTLPLIMISQGHVGYSVLLATPVSSIVTGSYVAVKNAVKFNQIVKSFGGLGKTFNHYKNYFKIKKFFNQNIFAKTDLIDINVKGSSYILTSTRENFLTRALSKLGFNKNLNYTNLVNVLESNNLMEDFLYAVKGTARPDHIKLLRIMNRVSLTQNEQVMSAIAENFSKDLKLVDGLNDFPHFKKWAINIAHSESMESFIKKLALMPTDVPPKIVDRFWRNYILPTSTKNIKPFMSRSISRSFNKMINGYNKDLFGDLAQSVDIQIGPGLHRKFLDYLFQSLADVGVCQGLYRKKGDQTPLLIQY